MVCCWTVSQSQCMVSRCGFSKRRRRVISRVNVLMTWGNFLLGLSHRHAGLRSSAHSPPGPCSETRWSGQVTCFSQRFIAGCGDALLIKATLLCEGLELEFVQTPRKTWLAVSLVFSSAHTCVRVRVGRPVRSEVYTQGRRHVCHIALHLYMYLCLCSAWRCWNPI